MGCESKVEAEARERSEMAAASTRCDELLSKVAGLGDDRAMTTEEVREFDADLRQAKVHCRAAKRDEEKFLTRADASIRSKEAEARKAEVFACETKGYFHTIWKRDSASGTEQAVCVERKVETSGTSATLELNKTNYEGLKGGGAWPVVMSEGTLECYSESGDLHFLFFKAHGRRFALNGTAGLCNGPWGDRRRPGICPGESEPFESIWLDDPKNPGLKILNSFLDEARGLCSKIKR
jgi:hypothetical protein